MSKAMTQTQTPTEENKKLRARVRELAGESLISLMSVISEDHYAAGWNGDLEFDLWRIVCGGNSSYGMGNVSAETIARLRQLSAECGGWHAGDGVVPLREWSQRYAAWVRDKLVPAHVDHAQYVRGLVGKTGFAGQLITEKDVKRAEENLAAARIELASVEAEAPAPSPARGTEVGK